MYKTEIIERIASVAGTSPYPTTRIHALSLFKKLIEHASVRKMRGKAKANFDIDFFFKFSMLIQKEKECELLNIQGSGLILRNLEVAEGETLREVTPLRDVLYRSIKIIRSLVEDFPCPDEHLLC